MRNTCVSNIVHGCSAANYGNGEAAFGCVEAAHPAMMQCPGLVTGKKINKKKGMKKLRESNGWASRGNNAEMCADLAKISPEMNEAQCNYLMGAECFSGMVWGCYDEHFGDLEGAGQCLESHGDDTWMSCVTGYMTQNPPPAGLWGFGKKAKKAKMGKKRALKKLADANGWPTTDGEFCGYLTQDSSSDEWNMDVCMFAMQNPCFSGHIHACSDAHYGDAEAAGRCVDARHDDGSLDSCFSLGKLQRGKTRKGGNWIF